MKSVSTVSKIITVTILTQSSSCHVALDLSVVFQAFSSIEKALQKSSKFPTRKPPLPPDKSGKIPEPPPLPPSSHPRTPGMSEGSAETSTSPASLNQPSDLLKAILEQGGQLKPSVDSNKQTKPGTKPDSLLEQIKKGMKLRKTSSEADRGFGVVPQLKEYTKKKCGLAQSDVKDFISGVFGYQSDIALKAIGDDLSVQMNRFAPLQAMHDLLCLDNLPAPENLSLVADAAGRDAWVDRISREHSDRAPYFKTMQQMKSYQNAMGVVSPVDNLYFELLHAWERYHVLLRGLEQRFQDDIKSRVDNLNQKLATARNKEVAGPEYSKVAAKKDVDRLQKELQALKEMKLSEALRKLLPKETPENVPTTPVVNIGVTLQNAFEKLKKVADAEPEATPGKKNPDQEFEQDWT